MAIFDRLGYNPALAGDNVTQYSDSVVKHMDALPELMPAWGQTDVANSDTGGYYQNPVGTVTQNIWNTSNTIIAITGLSSSNIAQIYTAASSLGSISANNFLGHTNRLSGVVQPNEQTVQFPHLDTAMGNGKIISYLVYQSDGIQNNAPIIGHFTSLYTLNDLTTHYQTIQTYPATIQHSMIATTTTDPDTGIPTTTYSSNLSQTVANSMAAELTAISTYMDTRRTADVNFYTNSSAVIADYNKVKAFNNMGSTQTDMVNNLIGTPKLLSRLNS